MAQFVMNSCHALYLSSLQTGKYGIILVALFCDFNQNYQPIAFRICKEESSNEWKEFLQGLLSRGLYQIHDLVIYHNGKEDLREAVFDVLPDFELHDCSFCLISTLRDIWKMYNTSLNDTQFNQFMALGVLAYFSTSEEGFNKYIQQIRDIHPVMGELFMNQVACHALYQFRFHHGNQFTFLPVYKALSHLPLPTTCVSASNETNSVELITADMLSLLQNLLYWMVDCSDFRRDSLNLYIHNDSLVPQYATEFCPAIINLLTVQGAAYEIQNQRFVCTDSTVLDKELRLTFCCDLNQKTCSCCLPQRLGYPCVHIIALLHATKHHDNVFQFVSSEYCKASISSTCPNLIVNMEENDIPYVITNQYNTGCYSMYSDLYCAFKKSKTAKELIGKDKFAQQLFGEDSPEARSFLKRIRLLNTILFVCLKVVGFQKNS